MRALLIVPSNDKGFIFIADFLSTKADIYPHIGLAYIAAVAEQTGHEIKIFDNRFHSFKEIKPEIKEFKPDVIGISATCFTIRNTLKIAELAKEINKHIIIVVGGPVVDIYPKEVLQHKSIDVICLEESEYSFTELLNAIKNNVNLKNVKGIAFKRNKKIIFSPPRPMMMDVDKIPFPARHLLENDKYYCALSKQKPVTTMISGRGCPFKCTYCLKKPAFRQTFRPRSPKNVVDEMEECIKEGFKEIMFFDDTFSASIQRAKEICREIIKRKVDVFWDIRTRVDCVDKELIKLLKKAKCVRIHYGVEAGDPYILKTLEKRINLEQAKKTFKITKEIGITTLAYFMLGLPRETVETVNRSINFAIDLNPDYVTFSPFVNMPYTETYNYSIEKNLIKSDIWRDYISGKTKIPSMYLNENIDYDTLRRLTAKAYRRFYFRPKKLLEIVKRMRSIDELSRATNIGLTMLKESV